MRSWFREGFYLGACLSMVLGIYLIRLWGAEHQVRLHTDHLLRSIEQKSWGKFATFIADDYHDQWEQDHETVLQRTRAVFSYVRAVHLVAEPVQIKIGNGSATWTARVTVQTDDTELGTLMRERVNGLTTPFTLEWRRQSGKPWDWKLVRVTNPELEIPNGFGM